MKKIVYCIMAWAVVATGCNLKGNGKGEQATNTNEVVVNANGFYIETLSDKDIYFEADTVLPDNPVVKDMVDVATEEDKALTELFEKRPEVLEG